MAFTSAIPLGSRSYAWQGIFLLFVLTVIGMLSVHLFGQVVSFSLLPLIAVILWPRGAAPVTSIIAMLIFGLLLDALTGGPLGVWALVILTLFAFIRPHQRLKPLNFRTAFMQVLGGLIFALILALGLAWISNSHRPYFLQFLPSFFTALLLFPMVYAIQSMLKHWFGGADERGL